MTHTINQLIATFAYDPENPKVSYLLALKYEELGQTAAAISYFLRAAERTDKPILAYECMLKIGLCFEREGNRGNSVRGAFLHAVNILPNRPEAYFLLARHYERANDHVLGYTFAEQGLAATETEPLGSSVEYPGTYGLIFQKAVSAWWWGKPEESRSLFSHLWNDHKMDMLHQTAVENNLKSLNIPYKQKSIIINITPEEIPVPIVNDIERMDIVLQGKYDSDTDEIIREYLKLPWVDRIIVSCWESDKPMSVFSNRLREVRSPLPVSPGTDNRNMQIVSSLAGIKRATTFYTAKLRSDQLYDLNSMNRMYEFFKKNRKPNKLFVAGTYTKLLFHPRDHIFWGSKEDLINLFSCPLETNGLADRINVKKEDLHKYYNEFTRAETYIGAHYIARFHPEVNRFLLHPEKFLFDGAPNWMDAHKLSLLYTDEYFTPFPRSGIDLKWKRKGWNSYPYDAQYESGERWGAELPDDLDMGDNVETFKQFVYNEIVNDRLYEKFKEVKDGDVVLDIGANVGVFPYSLKNRKPKRVICIEPSTSLITTLKKNVLKLPFPSDFFNYAIGSNNAIKATDEFTWVYGKPQSTFRTVTFKDMLLDANIDYIDFMKIDCEGGEYDIFNEENYEFLTTKVGYIAGEWHLGGLENGVEKFIQFKNRYLMGKSNFKVFEPYVWKDVTNEILNDSYIRGFFDWYNPNEAAQLQVYIDNGQK